MGETEERQVIIIIPGEFPLNVFGWSRGRTVEMWLSDGVEAYNKEGPKFMQRLVAKQNRD